MKNSRKIIIFALFLSIFLPGLTVHSSDRFDFSHTYLGLGVQHIPSGTSQVLNGMTSLENYEIPSRQNTRFFIGGLHFWNYVDFEISILLNGEVEKNGIKTDVNHGSSAGFATHFYPLPLTPYTIRPFVGIGLLSRVGYQQGNNSDNSPTVTFAQNPLRVGLAYRTKNHMFELGAQKLSRYKFDYYLSRTEKTNVKLSDTSYWLSYKYIMEATKKAKERKIKNAFTLGVGLSSGGFIKKSPFNENQRPFLDGNVLQKGAFPEFSLGYYHYDRDIQFNIAYRTNTTQDQGFGIEQEFSRSSVAFEIYQFLFDWNGFVPFIGPHINFDNVKFKETDGGIESFNRTDRMINYGITFGWDIKPVRRMKMILRTSLRYTVNDTPIFKNTPQEINSNIFEFNWIQAIFLF